MRRALQLVTAGLWLAFGLCNAKAAELKAGAAKADITPPIGFPMWGYGARHDMPSTGVMDPLHARALVLDVGGEKIALVSLDMGRAPTRDSTKAIRDRVKAEAGIEHLFLVGSHTHNGPVIETDNWPTPQNSYVRHLEQKIGDIILEANRALQPARLGIASKEVPYNHNRHTKLPEKPVDHEFLVLRVEDIHGKPIAHAINFAAHPTMINALVTKFSADYPGAMTGEMERATGVPCLFLQGAAGDLSPDSHGAHGPTEFGTMLGRVAFSMAQSIHGRSSESATLSVREDDFKFKSRIDFGNAAVRFAFNRAFYPDLVSFFLREYHDGIRPHMTTALLDGRIGFVGVSGEFFCTHSLNLKKRARLEHVIFMGYCNDYQQYFPTIEAAAEGGYGADPTVSPVEVGAGELMMNRALIHLYRMRGKLPDMNEKGLVRRSEIRNSKSETGSKPELRKGS